MISSDQLKFFTKRKKINETVIAREYLQLLFLSKLYSFKESKDIFFKGGTCLHLLYGAKRFSEDLDFTVNMNERNFLSFIEKVFKKFTEEEEGEFKERKTMAGKRFLLKTAPAILPYKIFINLDFSFREKVLKPEKSALASDYPIVFTSYIYHLSKEEIFAEKIRALFSRKKGRDLYDIWYLITQKVKVQNGLIQKKLKYYGLKKDKKDIIKETEIVKEKDFILDLRPFVPINERERLKDFFIYLKDFLKKNL